MTQRKSERSRLRAGFGITAFLLVLVAAGAVIVLVLGTWQAFVRESAPVILDWPGGPWAVGGLLGLASVLGALGGRWLSSGVSEETRLLRTARTIGTVVCWAVAFGPPMYALGALPGRNCPSYRSSCQYIPGTGSALVAYLLSAGLLGWLLFRRGSAVAEARRAREQERFRKLRKKGKGKSRAARGR
ncbi:hypothetical protein ACFWP7_01860 [Streptomyces sp. NPDC058470]|uniref:hypothetical protein n=1 Tax=Streptomyces sp. NPDC058470 TaxID=3346515 RepID=UPI003648766D